MPPQCHSIVIFDSCYLICRTRGSSQVRRHEACSGSFSSSLELRAAVSVRRLQSSMRARQSSRRKPKRRTITIVPPTRLAFCYSLQCLSHRAVPFCPYPVPGSSRLTYSVCRIVWGKTCQDVIDCGVEDFDRTLANILFPPAGDSLFNSASSNRCTKILPLSLTDLADVWPNTPSSAWMYFST